MPKKDSRKTSAAESMEQVLVRQAKEKYVLKLYITGMTPRSQEALRNIKKIIKENPNYNFDLEVIDIYQQPTLAKGDQILAIPTLVRKLPEPIRKIIGDLSNTERVLVGLNLYPRKED